MSEKSCRQLVYERSEQCCERCCRNGPYLSVHHRLKRGQGGKWAADNCVLLCGSGVQGCHGWVEHNPDSAHSEGFHVRPWERPEVTPVWWRKSKWVLLNSDGSMREWEI